MTPTDMDALDRRAPWNKASIDLARLKRDYLAGRKVPQIAEEYGVAFQTIYKYLKKLGITRDAETVLYV